MNGLIFQLLKENIGAGHARGLTDEGINLNPGGDHHDFARHVFDNYHDTKVKPFFVGNNSDPDYDPRTREHRIVLDVESPEADEEKKINPHPLVKDFVEKHGFTIHDYNNKMAKFGDGRSIKIGKILSKGNAPKEVHDAFQNDFANKVSKKRHSNLKIIISRHPYDVAGMSTNRGWTSCQDLEGMGSYRGLANEVNRGTHVAYLVNASDADARHLPAGSSLEHPISRIALRPFGSSSSGHKILHPSDKTYGGESEAFHYTLKKWQEKNFPLKNKHYGNWGHYIHDDESITKTDDDSIIDSVDKIHKMAKDLVDGELPDLKEENNADSLNHVAHLKTKFITDVTDRHHDSMKKIIEGHAMLESSASSFKSSPEHWNAFNKIVNSTGSHLDARRLMTTPKGMKHLLSLEHDEGKYDTAGMAKKILYFNPAAININFSNTKSPEDKKDYLHDVSKLIGKAGNSGIPFDQYDADKVFSMVSEFKYPDQESKEKIFHSATKALSNPIHRFHDDNSFGTTGYASFLRDAVEHGITSHVTSNAEEFLGHIAKHSTNKDFAAHAETLRKAHVQAGTK